MNRIKITQDGWAGFTGNIGGVDFVDGVSIDVVTQIQSDRISCSVLTVNADTDEQVGVTTRYLAEQATPMSVEEALPVITDEEIAASIVAAAEHTVEHYFTGDELEAIADEKGIAGLRAVAEPLGVKARAIPDLIANILAAQDAIRVRIAAATETPAEVVAPAKGA
jgi:hypothetical protein